ncbi:MAG: phosphate ABC transporter permease subunit PstC [Bacilli bacterium]
MKKTELKLKIDKVVQFIFMVIGLVAASAIVIIVLFIFIKGISPFINDYQGSGNASLLKFITGFTWTAGNYGILGMLINTLYLTLIATLVSSPISILTALFIVRIAPKRLSASIKSVIELLASIPSIIYGLFGMAVINFVVKNIGNLFNIQTAGGTSGLSTVIVLIIMMIPTITMISITSMEAVRQDQIHASLALGATKAQTDFKIVINGAKSGIFAAIILGVGRALGEATAVSMVCGNAITGPNLNLFDITRTLTSTMMLGLHESSGLDYDIRFSVGVVLMFIILLTSVTLNAIKRKLETK